MMSQPVAGSLPRGVYKDSPVTFTPEKGDPKDVEKVGNTGVRSLQALCFISGAALGGFAGTAVTVGLASPVGPVIAGVAIAILLPGIVVCGGDKRQVLAGVAFAVTGFGLGFAVGGISGMENAQEAAFIAWKKAGLARADLVKAIDATSWVIAPAIFGSIFSGIPAAIGMILADET